MTNQPASAKISSEYDSAIKQHYDNVAKNDKDSATSTMADLYIREKETALIIKQINKYIEQKNGKLSIVDVGCGNGYTLSKLSETFPDFDFEGVEFNDSLRAIAKERFLQKTTKISAGDIRLPESLPQKKFDVLICQRVIINLLNPEDQKNALNNLLELVKPNGLLIFIECFKSELINLNSARSEFGLDILPYAHHNLYLDDDFFTRSELNEFSFSEQNSFSTHYFVSRVLHPSFLKATAGDFLRNSHFVSFFSQALPDSIGNYSPLKLLAFKKV